MYKQSLFTLTGVAIFALAGCATTPSVYSKSDPKQDFSSYKTFSWAQNPPMIKSGDYVIPPMAEAALTDAIKDTLVSKGYVLTSNESAADFAVSYTVGARDKFTVKSIPATYYSNYDNWGWGYNYFPGRRYGTLNDRYDPFIGGSNFYGRDRRLTQISPARTETSLRIEGSISVDVFDVKTKHPVWHASASKILSKEDMRSPKTSEAETAAILLAEFPNWAAP